MRFGSVCSGIEAASVAWGPLGWKAAWLAEIEKFPSAVLAHHYPDVPNLGDMTQLPERILDGKVEAPDLFCGGTPCQAFSVAGLRKSLDDARGNLSLTFCEIANAIDVVRVRAGKPAAIVFWENVPGVLSTKDNAFGCFLAGLAGEDDPIKPPGKKWSNAGVVLGPQRAVAWRVLDAQYFGVAQRRRRVFVVASARDGFDPAAVLFEFDSLRRDTAPSRETGKSVANALTDRADRGGSNSEGQRLIPQAFALQHAQIGRKDSAGPQGKGWQEEVAFTQDSRSCADAVAVAFVQNSRDEVRLMGGDGSMVGALAAETGAKQQCYVAFHPTQDPISSTDGSTHALGCGSSGGQASVAVAQPVSREEIEQSQRERMRERFANRKPGQATADFDFPAPSDAIDWDEELNASVEQSGTLPRGGQGGRHDGVMTPAMQVRRLTPTECEALQGFPKNYTAIPWRKKPASECPDGPRYKALGNSWAVPNVRWIGRRIALAVEVSASGGAK